MSIRLALAATLVAAATACTTPAPVGGIAPPPASGSCNAEAARAAIGQAPTDAVVEQARVASGSRSVRVIHPGMAVTMDYREDRLNIDVNERGAIVGLRCG